MAKQSHAPGGFRAKTKSVMEDIYRATDPKSGEIVEFSLRNAGEPIVIDSDTGNAGGAAAPSAGYNVAPVVNNVFASMFQ